MGWDKDWEIVYQPLFSAQQPWQNQLFFFFFCQLKQVLIDLGRGNQEECTKPRDFLPPFLGLAPLQPPAVRGAGVRAMLSTLQGPPSALPWSISSFPDLAVPSFCSPLPTLCSGVSYPFLNLSSQKQYTQGLVGSAHWNCLGTQSIFPQKPSLHPPVIKNI